MRKLILLTFVLISSTALFAQKGSIYAGGALGFSEDQYKIAPEAGYWLGESLQLGAVISFESDKTWNAETTTFAPHVYLRKFFPLGEKFSVFAGANVRYSSTDTNNVSSSFTDAFIDLGFSYGLAERWGVVGRVASIGQINESFVFDFNMSNQPLFNVGIYYTIKQ